MKPPLLLLCGGVLASLLVGCAAHPKENLPPAPPWKTTDEALGILRDRAAAVKTVTSTGDITLARPGENTQPLNFSKTAAELSGKLKRDVIEDDLYSYLMYPQVFLEFARFEREYSDVSVLPTNAFFFGLKPGEEISVAIEEGKTLFIKLINVGAPDKDGYRIVLYELNGMPRESAVHDRSVQSKTRSRPKADPANPLQVGAPIPGLITSVDVSSKTRVAKGAKLITLEAMKMQTTIYAPADGVVEEIHVQAGDTVESRDLLVTMRE